MSARGAEGARSGEAGAFATQANFQSMTVNRYFDNGLAHYDA
jgi:hypothetical protein